jgi:preprotein translocase SecE subunit
VARDRKRTRPRFGSAAAEPVDAAPDLHPNVPEAVQHTGDVDEFDAQLLRGADVAGELVDGEPAVDEAELTRESEAAASDAFGGGDGGGDRRPVATDGAGAAAHPARKRSLFRRAINFLEASWAELQRVQWPDRRQVAQATAVVLGFVAVAGVYLGAADWLAQKIVNFIL